jgi:hypothetical protein
MEKWAGRVKGGSIVRPVMLDDPFFTNRSRVGVAALSTVSLLRPSMTTRIVLFTGVCLPFARVIKICLRFYKNPVKPYIKLGHNSNGIFKMRWMYMVLIFSWVRARLLQTEAMGGKLKFHPGPGKRGSDKKRIGQKRKHT